MSFMNKSLTRAYMKKSTLRNVCLKNKTETNRIDYTKQRISSVSLLRKTKNIITQI